MSVIIATPFKGVEGFAPYISSLIGTTTVLNKLGIEWDYWSLPGCAYVDDARNEMASRFLRDCDAKSLIFIDSDMSWTPEGFLRLLGADADVVGGCYPMKNNWTSWTCVWDTDEAGVPVGRQRADGEGVLLKARCLSGGFTKFSRVALERLKDSVGSYRIAPLHHPDPASLPPIYDFFTRIREGEAHHGEDISFGVRWSKIGGEMWIEPNIDFGHTGMKEWRGNLDGWLRDLRAVQQAEATGDLTAMVQMMAAAE